MPARESYPESPVITRRVRDFLSSRLLVRAAGLKLDDDTQLLERGFIDSTGVLELVSFLE